MAGNLPDNALAIISCLLRSLEKKPKITEKEKRPVKKVHKDFHGALNSGFQFLCEKYGKKIFREYLCQVGENIYKNLIEKIKSEGLAALEQYWRHIFTIEGGEFEISRKDDDEITLIVASCPALTYMKKVKYPVYKDFCLQCRIINEVIAEKAGLKSEFASNQSKNSCTQKLRREK